MAGAAGVAKTCVVCSADCSAKPRVKDAHGRYYCKPCYDAAMARQRNATRAPSPSDDDALNAAMMDKLIAAAAAPKPAHDRPGPEALAKSQAHVLSRAAGPSQPSAPTSGGIRCPSCERRYAAPTMICVDCGINMRSGRSIITAEQGDTDRIYSNAHSAVWLASWIVPVGIVPISSEAHGSHRPHAVRILALLTVFFTVWIWAYEWSGSSQMQVLKNLYLWAGEAEPDAERIYAFYQHTSYGDEAAFDAKMYELRSSVPYEQRPHAAVEALAPSESCFGEFHAGQLITHAFLHADILHLLSNLVFLLIIGSRVNALIGNVGALIVYPLLAVIAALAQMADMRDDMPAPMLGASGAIMGLAGMYLVFFPINRVHVALWARVPFTLFRLALKLFECRGFWILLFYVAFDVLYTIVNVEDGVAHWAHLGGFLAGMAFGLVLLLSRAVNPHGSDLLSVAFGRYAWWLLGKPSQWTSDGSPEGWLGRLRFIPPGAIQTALASVFPPRETPAKPRPRQLQ